MESLLEKLSSYNLFNNLFPGVLCAIAIDNMTSIPILQEDHIIGVFLYYFLGIVVSRVGSLLIEPLFKLTKFVEFAPYGDFLKASELDPKIDVLSETNNMFRTIIASVSLIFLVLLYERIIQAVGLTQNQSIYCALAILLILFAVSYKKQTAFIKKRVERKLSDS